MKTAIDRSVVVDLFDNNKPVYNNDYAVVAVDVIRATTTAITGVALGRQPLDAVVVWLHRLGQPRYLLRVVVQRIEELLHRQQLFHDVVDRACRADDVRHGDPERPMRIRRGVFGIHDGRVAGEAPPEERRDLPVSRCGARESEEQRATGEDPDGVRPIEHQVNRRRKTAAKGERFAIVRGGADSDVVRLLAPNQIPDYQTAVTVQGTGQLDLNGFNETIGAAGTCSGRPFCCHATMSPSRCDSRV